MSDDAAVRAAVAELYAMDPDGFVARRGELAAAARTRGDAEAARQIAALRRPTRSAWTTNALAHREPAAFDQVADIAEQLRDAERRLDGPALRALSGRRRTLIAEITRKAFAATGQRAPSAALREEVAGTLTAAFADPDVAHALRTGTLLRAAQWDGFGVASRPELALVAPPASKPASRPTSQPSRRAAEPAAEAKAEAEEAESQERERKARIAQANRSLAAAERELAAAQADEDTHRQELRRLDERTAEVRRGLDEARLRVRRAKTQLRDTQRLRDRAYRT